MSLKSHPQALSPPSSGTLETEIRRALSSAEGTNIESLVIRRLPNGICLEGVVRVSSDDLCSSASRGRWGRREQFGDLLELP
jgi:hypothetical protein